MGTLVTCRLIGSLPGYGNLWQVVLIEVIDGEIGGLLDQVLLLNERIILPGEVVGLLKREGGTILRQCRC